MASASVILDLSPIVRLDRTDDWRNVELSVRAWREQKDPRAVFYGVADNSLWYHMDSYGQRRLNEWKQRGVARSVPWADPYILDMAEQNPGAAVITTDLYRDHRRDHPWLQGSDRFFKPVISGSSVTLQQLDFAPIPDHEISWHVEDARLTPLGMKTPEGRQALMHEWSCRNTSCPWGSAPVIDDDPAFMEGGVCCPICHQPARRLGPREQTREVVVLIQGNVEVDRFPVAEGTSVVVGRGRGSSRYDVRSVLDDTRSALVSRDHLRVSNAAGRLQVEELGSKNGTGLVRPNAPESQLQPGIVQRLEAADRLSLARGALQLRPSGRQRAHGRYAPDLTTPPWRTTERNKD